MADARVQAVIAAQQSVTGAWMQQREVLGTAVSVDDSGSPTLLVYIDRAAPNRDSVIANLPTAVEGVTVTVQQTDRFRAQQGVSHTAIQTPPIQLGTSGGWTYDLANGYCCSGTLGSLISINGVQYVLSNWHVLESDSVLGGNNRIAQSGDPVVQPGLVDVNCSSASTQTIGTLLKKNSLPNNNVDCAVAQVSPGMVRTDGSILEIGTISSSTIAASLNQTVKKSGRTTGLTHGYVSGLNATVSVDYDTECAGSVAFTKTYSGQIVITGTGTSFSAGGDSGSLVVEDTATNPRPVGLLFAGSSSNTIANPINDVLNFLGGTMVGAGATTNYTISTSSNPSNGGTTGGAGTFAANTSQTVTAFANSGYVFSSWTENGGVVSTSASYTFTLTSNRNLVANFTVSSGTLPNLTPYQPSGWSDKIVVSNVTGTNSDTASLSSADNLYVDWAVINDGAANITTNFTIELYLDGNLQASWSNSPPTNIGSYRYVLDYNLGTLGPGTHTLRIKADSTNAIAESDETDNEYTKTITISSPNQPNLTPYQPSGWSDKIVVSNVTGTNTDTSGLTTADTLYLDWAVINNGAANITANFTTELYVDGILQASWSSSPPTNIGSFRYVLDYNLGSLGVGTHTLRIKADSTNAIAESDETDNEYTKTISVAAPSYTITTSSNPSNGGSTQICDPILCFGPSGTFASGNSVTAIASPSSGYSFSAWTENGSVISTSSSYNFTVTQNRNLVANFVPTNYFISTRSFAFYGGSTTGDGTFAPNTSHTVTATANNGFNFINWTENGNVVSTSPSYTFTLSQNRVLGANFTSLIATSLNAYGPDGGFEFFGDDWYLAGATATLSRNYPHSGTFDVELANNNFASDRATHCYLTIPANATSATLSFWLNIVTQEPSPASFDQLTVNLIDTSGVRHQLAFFTESNAGANTDGNYFQTTVDVSAYKGQAVQVEFVATNDVSYPTLFRVDDVSLVVAAPFTIMTSAMPAAAGTTGGNGSFASGSSRTVTAAANTGYAFAAWTENGIVVSTSSSYTFTVTGNRNLVAVFNASGGTSQDLFSPNGGFEYGPTTDWSLNGTGQIIQNSYPHSGSWDAYLANSNNSSGTLSHSFITIPANATTATVRAWLNIVTQEDGEPGGPYDHLSVNLVDGSGTTHQLAAYSELNAGANADGNYFQIAFDVSAYRGQQVQLQFVSSNDEINPTLFRIDDVSLTGVTPVTTNYTITTSSNPSNGGTTGGGGTFAANTSHTVTAIANSSYTFTNWTENGSVVSTSSSYNFTLTSNRNLVANFTSNVTPNYTITTSSSPSNGGTTGGGGTFAANTSHTVTATANPGYTFTNWTENGGVVSTSSSYTFSLTANRTLVANFATAVSNYTVAVTSQPIAGGTVTGGGTFAANTSATVTATAKTGYSFVNWTENGNVVSTSASYSFILTSNRSLTANFNPTNGSAQITSPAPGSVLTSPTVTFSWSAGTGTQYVLLIGSSPGATDYYTSGLTSARSVTVSGLPTDGRTIYVRLRTKIGLGYLGNDYAYVTGP